jgi:hypothetical protein
MMKRIGTIKQTLVGLARVFGDSVLSPELLRLLGTGNAPSPARFHARLSGGSDGVGHAAPRLPGRGPRASE